MSDTAPSRAWTYLFVITFSAIIVALGAHELHHHFVRKGGNVDVKKLVRDLKADPVEMRAGLSRRVNTSETEGNNEQVDQENKQDFKHIIERIAP